MSTNLRPRFPTEPVPYADAIKRVEEWLTTNALDANERERGLKAHVYDYFDGDCGALTGRPFCGVRVAEVTFSNESGGSSFMQVDQPWGIAVCGQVERCLLALIEGWNDGAHYVTTDGEGYWDRADTDEEFWRLGHLFTLTREAN